MTSEQALQILDQAASMAVLNRADHQKVAEAVQVLRNTIVPVDTEELKTSE